MTTLRRLLGLVALVIFVTSSTLPGATIERVQQYHEGVPIYGGELVYRNGVLVAGTVFDELSVDITPAFTACAEPCGQKTRLLVMVGPPARLCWRIESLLEVRFVDAHTGELILKHPNVYDHARTYVTTNCYALPGDCYIDENGPVPGRSPDELTQLTHEHTLTVYDWYLENLGLNAFDGAGALMRSTVHSGIPNGFFCDQNNAAFIPTLLQVVYGDGDNVRFGPFSQALDVVAHEWQHAVTHFAIRWPDGSPRGLDYHDESGTWNEAYSDFFACLVEGEDWRVGEDFYLAGEYLRNVADPKSVGMPDHYDDYVSEGSQSYIVHWNMGIASKVGQLMADGGTHYGVEVRGLGWTAAARIWWRALTMYMTGTSGFHDARGAMIAACQDLYLGDVATVEAAFASIGVGDVPNPTPTPAPTTTPAPTFEIWLPAVFSEGSEL